MTSDEVKVLQKEIALVNDKIERLTLDVDMISREVGLRNGPRLTTQLMQIEKSLRYLSENISNDYRSNLAPHLNHIDDNLVNLMKVVKVNNDMAQVTIANMQKRI